MKTTTDYAFAAKVRIEHFSEANIIFIGFEMNGGNGVGRDIGRGGMDKQLVIEVIVGGKKL
jgi:hypothetical protein